MGQGAESCGGYEIEYDEYEDGLSDGFWTQKDGSQIHINSMTLKHLINAKRLAENMARISNFSCDSEKWEEWVSLFEDRIYELRKKATVPPKNQAPFKNWRETKPRSKGR